MRLLNALILLFLFFLAAMVFAALVVEAKPVSKADAELAWEQIQADVKKDKAGPADEEDLDKANKLKDKEHKYVLFGKYGKTLKVELYDKDWKLRKTRYEREGWIVEETKRMLRVAGKEIVRERRVKIWNQE